MVLVDTGMGDGNLAPDGRWEPWVGIRGAKKRGSTVALYLLAVGVRRSFGACGSL